MNPNGKRLIAAAAIVVIGVAVGAWASSRGQSAAPPAVPPEFDAAHSDLDPVGAAHFSDFPIYSLGARFDNLPLVAITRHVSAPPARHPSGTNFVGYIYGTCTTTGDSGCAPPLEVQIWPTCVRNPSLYRLTPDRRPLPSGQTFVRGVRAGTSTTGRGSSSTPAASRSSSSAPAARSSTVRPQHREG